MMNSLSLTKYSRKLSQLLYMGSISGKTEKNISSLRFCVGIVGILFVGLVFNSCLDKDGLNNDSLNKQQVSVKLDLKIPDHALPEKRGKKVGLSPENESAVKSLDFIIFDNQNVFTGTDYRLDQWKGEALTIQLPAGEGYNLYILANCREAINQCNLVKNDPLSKLKAAVLKKENKWEAQDANPGYIPMWGEVLNTTIKEDCDLGTLQLYRMLARINVKLTGNAATKFELKNVRLYNPNQQGSIFPEPSKLSGSEFLEPTIPSDPDVATAPFEYDGNAIDQDKKGCTNQIYTFEANKENPTEPLKGPCLVIGGHYQNDPTDSYYRVDFSITDAQSGTSYLDLIRNNSYNVIITDITGSGRDSYDEAFKKPIGTIKHVVMNWNDTDLKQIVSFDEDLLAVSSDSIFLYNESYDWQKPEEANCFYVQTNKSGGWKIESIVDANNHPVDWLSIPDNEKKGTENQKYKIAFSSSKNNTGADREAYINVSAGIHLNLKIKVKDSSNNNSAIMIIESDENGTPIDTLGRKSTIEFDKTNPKLISLQVITSPKDSLCRIESKAIGKYIFDFKGTDQKSLSNFFDIKKISGESNVFYVKPPAITDAEIAADPMLIKQASVTFSITNNEGKTTQKTIIFKQMNYYFKVLCSSVNSYLNVSSYGYIPIKTNCPWKYTVENNTDNVMTEESWGNKGTGFEKLAIFGTNREVPSDTYTPTIVFSSPDKRFTDVRVPINVKKLNTLQLERISSCLILTPQYTPTYYMDAIQAKTGTTDLTAQLLWESKANLIRSVGVVQGYQKNWYNFTIERNSSSVEGNALIGIFDSSGKCVYIVHIWVTDYLPESIENETIHNGKIFMDRDLGALNSVRKNASTVGSQTLGLLYQWGNLIPYPNSKYESGNMGQMVDLYDIMSNKVNISSKQQAKVSWQNDVMANPLNMYNVQGSPEWTNDPVLYNWTSSDGGKGIYDPCPDGWRVPPESDWSGFPSKPYDRYANWFTTDGIDDYFEASGYIDPSLGKTNQIEKVGDRGAYRFGNSDNTGCMAISLSGHNCGMTNDPHCWAESIRCMKDDRPL